MGAADRLVSLNKLTKWRSWFAGWQLGTKPIGDSESDAVRDHRELSILLRAEVSALCGLLIQKGVFTAAEFSDSLDDEAERLDRDFAERFPGVTTTEYGIRMTAEAAETMKRMGFKP